MTAGPTMPGVIGGAHLKSSSATLTSVEERQGDSPKQQEGLETVGPTPPVEGHDVEQRTANLGSGGVVPGDVSVGEHLIGLQGDVVSVIQLSSCRIHRWT